MSHWRWNVPLVFLKSFIWICVIFSVSWLLNTNWTNSFHFMGTVLKDEKALENTSLVDVGNEWTVAFSKKLEELKVYLFGVFTSFLLPLHFGRFSNPFLVCFYELSLVVFFYSLLHFFLLVFGRSFGLWTICFRGWRILEFMIDRVVWCYFIFWDLWIYH